MVLLQASTKIAHNSSFPAHSIPFTTILICNINSESTTDFPNHGQTNKQQYPNISTSPPSNLHPPHRALITIAEGGRFHKSNSPLPLPLHPSLTTLRRHYYSRGKGADKKRITSPPPRFTTEAFLSLKGDDFKKCHPSPFPP